MRKKLLKIFGFKKSLNVERAFLMQEDPESLMKDQIRKMRNLKQELFSDKAVEQ